MLSKDWCDDSDVREACRFRVRGKAEEDDDAVDVLRNDEDEEDEDKDDICSGHILKTYFDGDPSIDSSV